jgi:hypothetical protein
VRQKEDHRLLLKVVGVYDGDTITGLNIKSGYKDAEMATCTSVKPNRMQMVGRRHVPLGFSPSCRHRQRRCFAHGPLVFAA